MVNASLSAIVRWCDRTLHTAKFLDYDGAVNGLQVENHGRITRIAAAVDASLATVQMAISAEADLLLVHHGLFWSRRQPWTGPNYRLLRLLVENNLAVYSSHLPLDAHPRLGNNARLCAALGFKHAKPFFRFKNQPVGLKISTRLPLDQLVQRLAAATNTTPNIVPGGPRICRRIGIVTGGAGGEIKQAADDGVDTFITGEGPHWTYALAEELGINVLYAGHYATETFGVNALAAELSARFRLPWVYLDHPTGL